MRKRNVAIVTSAIGMSVLALAGCGTQSQVSVSSNVTTKNSTTNNVSGSTGNTTVADNYSAKNTTNSTSSNTDANSTQSSNSSTHKGSNSVLQSAVKSISNTSVPVLVPSVVPIPQSQSGRYLTAQTLSSKSSYRIQLMTTDQPVQINAHSLVNVKGTNKLVILKGRHYQSVSAAQEKVSSLWKFGASSQLGSVNLGDGISAKKLGAGTGITKYRWKEGNWNIEVNTYTPTKGLSLAKKIVAYLHTHYLPAPTSKGVIGIWSGLASNDGIAWNKGKDVYQILGPQFHTDAAIKNGMNSMELLKIAVSMHRR